MAAELIGVTDDPVELAELVRREYGSRLPPAAVRESHADRELRSEKTQHVLGHDVMPLVNEARVRAGRPTLSVEEEDRVIELVISSMFLLPHVLGTLEREPLAEDLVVLGASPMRVDRADGTMGEYPPIVQHDRDLERVIAQVAEQNHRPFNFEHPFVDVQLSPRLRFHGQGFDIVDRPAIFIRVHRVMGATIEDQYTWGNMSAGIAYLLGEVVPSARLKVAFTGVQGSGKTTTLRSTTLAYPRETRVSTIETDFELAIRELDRPWAHAMQARIPVTSKDRGITPGDLMVPNLRTRSELNIVGEVRGDEGAPAIRAANIGQGTMVTVHGDTAEEGLEQLVDRVCEGGVRRDIATSMVYKSFDLVVHCQMAPDRRRWIGEIVHPLMEGDRPKIHTLYEPSSSAPDARARSTSASWPPQLLNKIQMNFPDFELGRVLDDTYRPLHAAAGSGPETNGDHHTVEQGAGS